MADTSASGGNIVTGSGVASSRTALNLSLFKSGTLVKFIIGLVVSIFAVAATTTTVMVVVIRSDPRYPVAVSDALLTYKNVPAPINPVTNDLVEEGKFSSGDQNALEVIAVGQPANGIAKLIDGAKNQIQYTPNPGFIGEDQFTYTVKNSKFSSVGLINVTVLNHVPEPANDEATASKNKEKEIFVLENDIDVDNDTLVVVGVGELSIPDVGTVRFTNRSVIFAPAPQVVRKVSFSYLVFDGNNTANASVTITVLNDPPVAAPDSGFAYINTVSRINVLANDADINGDRLSILYADGAENGVLDFTSDPSIVAYTPRWGFVGADRFEYIITDGFEDPESGQLTSDRTTVEIEIVNRPPRAEDYTVNVRKQSDFVELLRDDMWGDLDTYSTLEMRILNNASLGETNFTKTSHVNEVYWIDANETYVTNDYSLLYKPDSKVACDAVDHLNYSVSDGMAATQGKITINIFNTPPVAEDDNVTSAFHWRETIAIDVLENDSDPDNDPISLVGIAQSPLYGAALTDGTRITYAVTQMGASFFSAADNRYELDDSFVYRITDGCPTGYDQASVHVRAYNHRPVANPNTFPLGKAKKNGPSVTLDVLEDDTDPDQQDIPYLTITSTKNTVGCSVSIVNNNKQIRFTPNRGFNGNATFQYAISDGHASSDFVTVTVPIENAPPTCSNLQATVPKSARRAGAYATFSVASNSLNCVDPDGDAVFITGVGPVKDSKGEVIFVPATSNQYFKFLPNIDRSGQFSIPFTVSDGVTSRTFTLTVTVTNNAPVASSDNLGAWLKTATSPRTLSINLLSNDRDPDNDALQVTGINGGGLTATLSGGVVVTSTSNGAVTISWPYYYYGSQSFTYTITDNDRDNPRTASATATFTINGYAPVARDDLASVEWGTTKTIDVISNDYDQDGDAITLYSVDQPDNGDSAYISGNKIVYTSSGRTCNTARVRYTIRTVDGFASATLTVDIVKCYCLAKIELIFVVDGSGSVGQSNFNNVIKPFLKDVTAGFDLDKRDPSDGSAVGTRAGLIHFSSSAQYETTSWVTSNAAMYNEINQMYYRGGSTNTKAGLQYAVNFFNNNGGARPPQFPPDPNPVVIIILTDGEWNTGGDPKPLAEDINNRPGWRIYAVAVATADYNEIRALAWNPTENVGFFSASNWDALKRQEFVQSIIDQACDNKQAL